MAFAFAYAFMQVGRSLFMLWALKKRSPGNYRNFQRIGAWQTVAAALWIAGAFADGGTRLWLWGLALLLETLAPAVGFWTPGLGRSTTEDWDVEGSHLAERCGLFIIIALGESVLVTGAKFANLPWDAPTIAAFAVSFIGSVAMWWIYFNIGAETASRRISRSRDPGRLARFAYTYMHRPAGGRHHRGRGRRRARARASNRPHRSGDGRRAAGRTRAVSAGQPAVQARDRRPAGAVALGRPGPAGFAGAGVVRACSPWCWGR